MPRGRPKGIPNPNAGRKKGSNRRIPEKNVNAVLDLYNSGERIFDIVLKTQLSDYLVRKIIRNNIHADQNIKREEDVKESTEASRDE